jgi:ubiquinone/menaquinone biosynthesis C-methylase UbiE
MMTLVPSKAWSVMAYEKFNVAELERLNDEARLEYLPPDVMWKALGEPAPGTIVDVGAGTGMFSTRFAEMAPHANVYAVDIEPTMVRWMMEHKPAAIAERLHPILARETAVPLGTGEADLVVMINLHHELVDPQGAYREALRILAIGGQILVADWAPGADSPRPPQHLRASAEQISSVLSSVGFDSIISHPGLPKHSLITACKPAVCGI